MEPTPQGKTLEQLTAEGFEPVYSADEAKEAGFEPISEPEKPQTPGALETFGRFAEPSGVLNELIASAKTKGKGEIVPYQVSGTTQYRYEPSPEEAEERKRQGEITSAGLKEHPVAAIAGLVAPVLAQGKGLTVLEKLLPWLRGVEATKAASAMERSTKPLAQAVREATSSLGGTTAKTSGAAKTLGGGLDAALPEAEIAANRAALQTPEMQAAATDVARNLREDLPGQLAKQVSKREELAAAKEALEKGQEYGLTRGSNVRTLGSHLLGQTKRYGTRLGLGAAAGVYGALQGEDRPIEERLKSGMIYGLAIGPTLQALRKNFVRPDTQRLAAGVTGDLVDKIIQLGSGGGSASAAIAQRLAIAGKNPAIQAKVQALLEGNPQYRMLARKAAQDKNSGGGAEGGGE